MNAMGFRSGKGEGADPEAVGDQRGRSGGSARARAPGPLVSVIVPVTERVEPLAELYEEYASALRAAGHSLEFLFVAGPAHEAALLPVRHLAASGEPIRVYTVGQSLSDGPLVRVAATHAWGRVIVTLPSYRRVTPEALPLLISKVAEGSDIAVARRISRADPWINRIQARLFGALLGRVAESGLVDVGSGVRAMPRSVLTRLSPEGSSQRFLPILAARDGYVVREVAVPQHPSAAGARVHRPDIYLQRLIDLLGLFFLLRFKEKPLRFFGLLGATSGLAGFMVLAVLAVQRLGGLPLGDRPMLLVGLLGVVLGVQLLALGLIGEIIVHHHPPDWRPYRRRDAEEGWGP